MTRIWDWALGAACRSGAPRPTSPTSCRWRTAPASQSIDDAGLVLPMLDYQQEICRFRRGIRKAGARFRGYRLPAPALRPQYGPAAVLAAAQVSRRSSPAPRRSSAMRNTGPSCSAALPQANSPLLAVTPIYGGRAPPISRALVDAGRLAQADAATPRGAGDVLGPIKPEIAARTGLSPHCRVRCGIHDSNADLPALAPAPAMSRSPSSRPAPGSLFWPRAARCRRMASSSIASAMSMRWAIWCRARASWADANTRSSSGDAAEDAGAAGAAPCRIHRQSLLRSARLLRSGRTVRGHARPVRRCRRQRCDPVAPRHLGRALLRR